MCCKCSFFVEMDSCSRSRLDSVERNHCSFDAGSYGAAAAVVAQMGNCTGSTGNIVAKKEELVSSMTRGVVEGVPEEKKIIWFENKLKIIPVPKDEKKFDEIR